MTVSGVGSSSSSSSVIDRTTIANNFDTFLQLLTTQLKNQNPLDPLDTNQFTQQLVEFSGVEQQLKTNDFLSSLVQANANTTNSNAVNYIGKTVTASGVRSELVNGKAQWNFSVDDAAVVTVNIKDENGNTVYSEQGAMQAGSGTFTWDGKDNQGNVRPDGTYSISMQAVTPEGKTINVSTETTGTVTGVDFTGSEPVLLVGKARLNLSGVTSVRTAS
ncbi:MAG: flagellar hook assembly protein FlgD [Devosia sp.]|jgi:flagellar basal-body rod modification protein FlgD|nr:flagellar hook assembly protein FlgD [Candidatus Saccharimonadales bacterium]HVX73634.1 flagellar hook assembly protein FlgD [Devosia sp.]